MRTIIRLAQTAVRSHLEWIYRVTRVYPGRTVIVSTLLLILAGISLTTVRFESDIFKLFPSNKGALRLFLDSLDWTGGAEHAYFLLEGEKDRLPAEAEKFAERLKALKVDGAPAFKRVAYRVYDPEELESFAGFLQYAVGKPQVFLTPDQTDSFVKALAPESLSRSLHRASSELAVGTGMGMREVVAADPFYLRELILPRLKLGSQDLALDPESPYFLSKDGRLLIMVAETTRPVRDMEFSRKLVAGINAARAGAGVTISCAGAHLSAVIDESVMKANIIESVVSSLFVVLGIFYLTYRRVLPTLLIPVIILCGTVLSLGTAALFTSSIHIISFAFTALIIGLGTDYSIHIYDRYYSERSAGVDVDRALHRAVTHTGQATFSAAFTTAVPFLILVISDVRALSELGLLVGLGVIFSLYATLFFLPPLLVFVERRFPNARYQPLPSFGLFALWRCTGRRRGIILALTVVAIVGSLAASFFISFEGELKNLQPRHSEALLTQEKIERHLSIAPKQMLVAVEGKDLADVLARGERVAALSEGYRERGELVALSWLGRVVNLPDVQQGILRQIKARLGGRDPAKGAVGALEQSGFDPGQFAGTLSALRALPEGKPVPFEELLQRLKDSPFRQMADRFLVERDGTYHLLLYLHYRDGAFRQQAFLKELAHIDPSARATSTDLVGAQLADSVRVSFTQGFLIGGIMVLFLLVVQFESLAGIGASLFPVLSGVVAMLGLMVATGMRLNFMNSMVLVTILGMGSDYGLHLYFRVEGRSGEDAAAQFVQAGRAVVLSALTTIAGFGSLAFTDYGAMSSIGWATNYGVAATLLFTMVSLPAFLGRDGRRDPGSK